MAHLALACSRLHRLTGPDARSAFDRLSVALGDALDNGRGTGRNAETGTLTPQERQVAELASTGARTREIAEAVSLSQKTVEYHLTRVYRKLGVRSKAELAFAFRSSRGVTRPPLVRTGH